jgi:putative aldouronate transport system permease protein
MSKLLIIKKKKKLSKINSISTGSNLVLHLIFILYTLACLVPVFVVLSVSFSTEAKIAIDGYGFLPNGFTLRAYEFLFDTGSEVGQAYINTIVATVVGTLICVTMVSLYSYPLSRPDFQFRNGFTFFMFFTMLFGVGLVPFYIVCKNILHIYNTRWALFLPLAFNAFWVIVMRTFYKTTIPDSLIESARIDGAGEIFTWVTIVLPLSIPGIATIALFSTINIWNNFFMSLLLTESSRMQNLQHLIYSSLNNVQYLRQLIQMGLRFRKSAGNSG